ncbi:hypothetical protein [Halobellus rarus]|uniref:Uncharacterized protein n=1 Tax=Halobellus rarus TaxID=1126237 RepID=A0ABD6CLF1_9EURY|nr:hypothetical protein [Halobellus rarus]
MDGARVVSKTISDFRNHCFEEGDKFRYAAIVPQSTLSGLDDTEEYEYVELSAPQADADGTLAQIIAFSDDHDVAEFSTDEGRPWACIRTRLQREIGLDPDDGDEDENMEVVIRECDTETLDDLTVHRVSAWEQEDRDITTEGLAGYISAGDMDDTDALQRGDVCELINPKTGARIQLPIETYDHKGRKDNTIRINGITRKLLRVDSKDEGDTNEVRLRILTEVDEAEGILERASKWLGRRFVDYSYSNFRVLPGYDRDEGRNVVRMNEDAMKGLGIEENDRVLLSWLRDEKRRRNVRCQSGWEEDTDLEPEATPDSSYGEEESLSVRIPSTERDNLNISVGDSIQIRRDMRYQAGKQVSLSAFGILGVIVGTGQLINMVFQRITLAYVVSSVTLVLVLSVLTVWLVMNPIRQKCRTPE